MNTPMQVINPAGAPPHFGNLYVLAWTFVNLAIMLGIVILIIWLIKQIKQKADFRKQLLDRMDSLISLLQNQKNHE